MACNATALIAGAVMAGSLFAAAPALASSSATASAEPCPANRFCAWLEPGGTGLITFPPGSGGDLTGEADNNIDSVWNRTSTPWCLYDGRGFRNLIAEVAPGGSGNLAPPMRNRISSLRAC